MVISNIHGMTGQRNAAKAVTKSAVLTIRCKPQERASWVKASKDQKLVDWVTNTLNAASENNNSK